MNFFGREINLPLSTRVSASQGSQIDLQDPLYLQMHKRAVRQTDIGAAGLIKVDIIDNKVKFIATVDNSIHDSYAEASNAISTSGFTTFARISENLEEGPADFRGLGGMRQRLIDMKNYLRANPNAASQFGISVEEIDSIKFITGTAKAESGAEANNILKRLKNSIIVPDEKELNVFQISVGADRGARMLSQEQILGLLNISSQGTGGLLAREELIDILQDGKLGSLFSKLGKRVRGAIGLKSVSLAGEELALSLEGFGRGLLDDKAIRVFDPKTELLRPALALVEEIAARRKHYI